MKTGFTAMFVLLVASFPAFGGKENSCSSINSCHIEKKSWDKKGWVVDYAKDLPISSLCRPNRISLQLEPNLGVELWVFEGDKGSSNWLESRRRVTASLYTYKLTYVVATGSAPLESTGFSFSHRLDPKGKTFVEVSCFKN